MARKIIWTENAKEDLREIISYLKHEWSNQVAENFVDDCYSRIHLIAQFPYIGVASGKIKSVRRIFITKHNSIYYFADENEIFLLDFFDNRQSPQKNIYE